MPSDCTEVADEHDTDDVECLREAHTVVNSCHFLRIEERPAEHFYSEAPLFVFNLSGRESFE